MTDVDDIGNDLARPAAMKSRSMACRLLSWEQRVTYGRYFTTFLLVTLVGCSDDPGQTQASATAGNASFVAAGNAGTNSGGDAGSTDRGAAGGSQAMGGATSVGGRVSYPVPCTSRAPCSSGGSTPTLATQTHTWSLGSG